MENKRNKFEKLYPFLVVYLILMFIAFMVNIVKEGAYVSQTDKGKSTYWIGAIGTTIPFLILSTIAFLDILNGWKRNQSRWLPFSGFLCGWLSMMSFTLWVITLEPFSGISSTMGIAVLFTPIIYIFLFPIPYWAGRLVCWFLLRWLKKQSGSANNRW
ncbi:MAG TPA: hypothetical protein PK525_11725 [Anaerohalosphaeraceae bacterium]|nr:hypothetical protein [Anaerohalosphaeraceae bacterium]